MIKKYVSVTISVDDALKIRAPEQYSYITGAPNPDERKSRGFDVWYPKPVMTLGELMWCIQRECPGNMAESLAVNSGEFRSFSSRDIDVVLSESLLTFSLKERNVDPEKLVALIDKAWNVATSMRLPSTQKLILQKLIPKGLEMAQDYRYLLRLTPTLLMHYLKDPLTRDVLSTEVLMDVYKEAYNGCKRIKDVPHKAAYLHSLSAQKGNFGLEASTTFIHDIGLDGNTFLRSYQLAKRDMFKQMGSDHLSYQESREMMLRQTNHMLRVVALCVDRFYEQPDDGRYFLSQVMPYIAQDNDGSLNVETDEIEYRAMTRSSMLYFLDGFSTTFSTLNQEGDLSPILSVLVHIFSNPTYKEWQKAAMAFLLGGNAIDQCVQVMRALPSDRVLPFAQNVVGGCSLFSLSDLVQQLLSVSTIEAVGVDTVVSALRCVSNRDAESFSSIKTALDQQSVCEALGVDAVVILLDMLSPSYRDHAKRVVNEFAKEGAWYEPLTRTMFCYFTYDDPRLTASVAPTFLNLEYGNKQEMDMFYEGHSRSGYTQVLDLGRNLSAHWKRSRIPTCLVTQTYASEFLNRLKASPAYACAQFYTGFFESKPPCDVSESVRACYQHVVKQAVAFLNSQKQSNPSYLKALKPKLVAWCKALAIEDQSDALGAKPSRTSFFRQPMKRLSRLIHRLGKGRHSKSSSKGDVHTASRPLYSAFRKTSTVTTPEEPAPLLLHPGEQDHDLATASSVTGDSVATVSDRPMPTYPGGLADQKSIWMESPVVETVSLDSHDPARSEEDEPKHKLPLVDLSDAVQVGLSPAFMELLVDKHDLACSEEGKPKHELPLVDLSDAEQVGLSPVFMELLSNSGKIVVEPEQKPEPTLDADSEPDFPAVPTGLPTRSPSRKIMAVAW